MGTMADKIETYLKQLISRSPSGVIEIQRNLIAEKFSCVPSQITYVLGTRFTPENGYLVESRRGGGGYLKIRRITFNNFSTSNFPKEHSQLRRIISRTIGPAVSQDVGEELVAALQKEGFLTVKEAKLIKAVIKREVIPLGLPERDVVRASILRAVLLTVLQND